MDIERQINHHKDAVYRQMVRTCGNHADAEDALADALLGAIKAADQLRDPQNFQAWLAKIGTRSCARMRIRERLLKQTSLSELLDHGIELPESDADPAAQAVAGLIKECVSSAVAQLPPHYRDVYVQREILGEGAGTVAKRLALTVPALKSRLHRARQLVRDSLDSGFGCGDLS
ncbi:MAG: RNA polymerase sigma factor [Fimbriimonadaceae bacterium]